MIAKKYLVVNRVRRAPLAKAVVGTGPGAGRNSNERSRHDRELAQGMQAASALLLPR